MSNSLDVLDKHRDALLLAEVGAWLHMFGKLHEEFLDGKHELDCEIPKDVPAELSRILGNGKWTGDIWNELPIPSTNLGAAGLSIYNMIEGHRPLKSESAGFIQLMAEAHGRGSGIEKGILDRFAPGQKTDVYLSTSLGYEPDTTIDRDKLRQERNKLYDFLQQQLAWLEKKNAKLSINEWITFRSTFIQQILHSFSGTVAETRRPLNDVTLFDQTSMSVAFFKAALAHNLLEGWKDPSREEVAHKYRWRLLRVGLNGLTFWGNSVRVSDLLARKRLIKDALDEAQILLEVTYPLGAEIYRDENGSIFVVPDIDNLLSKTDSSQSLEDQLKAITSEESITSLSGETQFSMLLSKETRDTLLFGELAMRILPASTPQFTWLQKQWKGKERDICPICGSRPQGLGEKALDRKVCDICEKRRSDRSKKWIDHPATTIWVDEIADKEGKLALLVGYFGIVDWLSGSAFNTVLSLNPRSQRISSDDTPSQDVDFDLQMLNNAILEGLRPGQKFKKKNLLGKLVRKDSRKGGLENVQDFYDFHVNEDTTLGTLPSSRRPELLTLSLLRQNPSPARIRRTWETTKKFWEEVESGLNDTVKEIGTRIVIHGTFLRGRSSWGPPIVSHTYELKVNMVNLSIVCTNDGEFITADNLQRMAILLGAPKEATQNYTNAAQYVFERIQSRNMLEIAEPAGYGRLNQMPGLLEIGTIHQEQHFPYIPAITLVNEPRTFMALVPAQDAWKTLEKIKEKYEKEMGKVRNRLPMTIGAVFTDSRTPLPAILNAGRRMLKQPTTDECWIVVEQKPDPSSCEVTLILKNATHLLSVKVPTRMGDRTTEDVWYPYWCVEKDAAGNTPSGRERHIQGVDGKEWVHVRNLEVGDVVHFKPSRFDFELLDTAARRFEISYENGMRRGSYHPARPYYLEELNDFKMLWQILSRGLANSQIHDLIEFIETKRTLWDTKKDDATFQRMVRDALSNASWHSRPTESELDRLEQAALSGQLTDVFELYVRILKNAIEIDTAGGNT